MDGCNGGEKENAMAAGGTVALLTSMLLLLVFSLIFCSVSSAILTAGNRAAGLG